MIHSLVNNLAGQVFPPEDFPALRRFRTIPSPLPAGDEFIWYRRAWIGQAEVDAGTAGIGELSQLER